MKKQGEDRQVLIFLPFTCKKSPFFKTSLKSTPMQFL